MNDETARALNDINRRFYRERAAEFSATRRDPWPGWTQLAEQLDREGLADDLDVLDVGCGNGRFAVFLAERLAGRPFRYTGIDASPELLALARSQPRGGGCARFAVVDFVETAPDRALPRGAFSLVVLFGVLHGVPGRARRRSLLAAAAERLRPGGLLVFTAWRLAAYQRFAHKHVAWERFNAGADRPIDPEQLEEGDRLLPWGQGDGEAVRYCHTGGEREGELLLADLALDPLPGWCADGREGGLNRYLVARAPEVRA